MFVKNMERMTSVMLLLVVMLGVVIESSQATKCYVCSPCSGSASIQDQDCGDQVCAKADYEDPSGAIRLLFD